MSGPGPRPGPPAAAARGPAGSAATTAAAIPGLLLARRSRRAFADDPVDAALLDRLVLAACLAPAPHHSRPWRFVTCTTPGAKRALAEAMARRWAHDLAADGVDPEVIARRTGASVRRLEAAPALVLACLTDEGLDAYPDPPRRAAEWGLALCSLGAAVQNLLLAATDAGLASCWVAAPMFCPDEAAAALDLPDGWRPQALVMLGRPAPGGSDRDRPPVPLEELRARR